MFTGGALYRQSITTEEHGAKRQTTTSTQTSKAEERISTVWENFLQAH